MGFPLDFLFKAEAVLGSSLCHEYSVNCRIGLTLYELTQVDAIQLIVIIKIMWLF